MKRYVLLNAAILSCATSMLVAERGGYEFGGDVTPGKARPTPSTQSSGGQEFGSDVTMPGRGMPTKQTQSSGGQEFGGSVRRVLDRQSQQSSGGQEFGGEVRSEYYFATDLIEQYRKIMADRASRINKEFEEVEKLSNEYWNKIEKLKQLSPSQRSELLQKLDHIRRNFVRETA